jgi:hypothetical protein
MQYNDRDLQQYDVVIERDSPVIAGYLSTVSQ